MKKEGEKINRKQRSKWREEREKLREYCSKGGRQGIRKRKEKGMEEQKWKREGRE